LFARVFFLFTWHGNNLRVWGVKPQQQQQYTLVRPSAQRYPVYRELAPLGYALTKRRVYSDGGQPKEIRTLIQRSSLVKTCFLQMSFNQRSAFKSNNISLADDKTWLSLFKAGKCVTQRHSPSPPSPTTSRGHLPISHQAVSDSLF
jgi:hypothetical protein